MAHYVDATFLLLCTMLLCFIDVIIHPICFVYKQITQLWSFSLHLMYHYILNCNLHNMQKKSYILFFWNFVFNLYHPLHCKSILNWNNICKLMLLHNSQRWTKLIHLNSPSCPTTNHPITHYNRRKIDASCSTQLEKIQTLNL